MDFISRRKTSKTKPSYVPVNVWESWMQLWGDAKSVERSEINSKNRCGGREVAGGTHTRGSISIGEHRKKLAVEKGRDPTPSELHLHVHTHGHDGKSFIAERSRIIHKYCGKKHNLRQILINVKHIMKPREEKKGKEYMVLDLK